MRVLIEASEAYRNQGGIGRFSRELIGHLPPALDVVFSPANYADRLPDPSPRDRTRRVRHFAEHLWLSQVQAAYALMRQRPDVLHALSFFVSALSVAVPQVVTIFDLAYFDRPQETDSYWGAYARAMMPRFAARASAVITTSDVMREKIIDRFRLSPARVYRIYGAASSRFTPVTNPAVLAGVRRKYALPARFVLYSGAWHATKNLPVLLQAMAGIDEVELVITGKPHSPEEARLPALARALSARVHFIGHLPDEDLPALYSAAEVVVQPSLYEGFGLPVIEAMACGAAVVVSDIPVLAEIAGAAAPRFRPESADELREVLQALMTSPGELARWRKLAQQRASAFCWSETARQVVEVWSRV
jgi:glycosyltransferase involved in cell wall biosynthesis